MSTKKLNAKSPKNDILEAYNSLLEEVQAEQENNRSHKQERQKQQEILKEAERSTPKDIIHQIASLKVSMNHALDDLNTQLVIEKEKLMHLQEAINIETKRLEDTYAITANADSLETLLLAQQRNKEETEKAQLDKQLLFEKEITEKRLFWKKEQEDYEIKKKEKEEELKKERKREEEEYFYQRQLKRQKEEDQYEREKNTLERELEEKRHGFEKEFGEREENIRAQEEEIKMLKEAKEHSIVRIKEEVEAAKKQVNETLEKQYRFERELQAKETEGQLTLLKQMIASLEEKLKEKQSLIADIAKQLQLAQMQSQELAKKAIESISHSKNTNVPVEIKEERKTVSP